MPGILLGITETENQKNTPPYAHNQINAYFTDKYGYPYRNGVFVTGDKALAGGYGEVYAVYPVNGYTYLWNPQITDLWEDLFDNAHILMSFMQSVQPEGQWQSTEKSSALRDSDRIKSILDHFGYTFYDVMGFVEQNIHPYQTTNIVAAAKSMNEVMLKTNKYYYLQKDLVDTFLHGDW